MASLRHQARAQHGRSIDENAQDRLRPERRAMTGPVLHPVAIIGGDVVVQQIGKIAAIRRSAGGGILWTIAILIRNPG